MTQPLPPVVGPDPSNTPIEQLVEPLDPADTAPADLQKLPGYDLDAIVADDADH